MGFLLEEERGGDPFSPLQGRWWQWRAPRATVWGQGTVQPASGQVHGLPAALPA